MELESGAATVCEKTPENDRRPEYCQYRDEGCKLSGSCLQCPFAECVYDRPSGKRRILAKMRDLKISELFRQRKNTQELTVMFGLSRRTIQRIIKKLNAGMINK